jgi:hypothetical protein
VTLFWSEGKEKLLPSRNDSEAKKKERKKNPPSAVYAAFQESRPWPKKPFKEKEKIGNMPQCGSELK